MLRRIDRLAGSYWASLRMIDESRGRIPVNGTRRRRDDRWDDGTFPDGRPRESLAHRLESDPGGASRLANWLLIKGWLSVILILGLILFGVVGGLLATR